MLHMLSGPGMLSKEALLFQLNSQGSLRKGIVSAYICPFQLQCQVCMQKLLQPEDCFEDPCIFQFVSPSVNLFEDYYFHNSFQEPAKSELFRLSSCLHHLPIKMFSCMLHTHRIFRLFGEFLLLTLLFCLLCRMTELHKHK